MKMRKVFSFFILLLLIVLTYQNCADISLEAIDNQQSSITANTSGGVLPEPKIIPPNTRVVIVVDHSFSMVWDKCSSDLDGSSPQAVDSTFNSCAREPGVDQVTNRYKIISKWLDELENSGSQDIKVMLLPFSGGKAQRPRVGFTQDIANMDFISISEARQWLDILVDEQNQMISDGSQELMGTTVYTPILDYALAKIEEEVNGLKNLDKLNDTNFEYVFMTDGVYKPTKALFGMIRQVSGCPDCSLPGSQSEDACCSSCSFAGTNPYRYCNRLEQNFKNFFGDPELNVLDQVKQKFNQLLDLPKKTNFNGMNLNVKLVKINWAEVPPEDKNSGSDITKNIFDELKPQLTQNIPVYNIFNDEPPFSIFSKSSSSTTFILKNLYAINRNVFVNQNNKIVVDSDGDGLSDALEAQLGYNSQNPRSNGFCLDIITENFSCRKINCNPQLDKDKDGLNECEEFTIFTDDSSFDTDGDNIPDFFEVVRGLNPNRDDSNVFSANDPYSDHIHFRKGVSIHQNISSVATRQLVDMNIEFNSMKSINGTNLAAGSYVFDLKNMPLLKTLALPASEIMATYEDSSDPVGTKIDDNIRLDSLAKNVGENELVFLMQITSLENSKLNAWYVLKKRVKAESFSTFVELDENFKFKNFHQILGEIQ